MKSMKKLVLVGLVLLASVIVLVGCDTNAGDTPSSTGGTTQQPGSEGTGGDSANKALTLTIEDANGNSMSVTLQYDDSDGFYEIGTADELYAFAAAVNDKGKTTIKGKLTSNIVVNETVLDEEGKLSENVRPWTPIGNGDTPYTGTFDGAGCTISGLSFNDTNADYAGLFGYLGKGGSVQNLGILDSYFCGGMCVGGVVGYNDGDVSECFNEGSVTGEGFFCYVGGVVGENAGAVSNCYNTGSVSGTNEDHRCYVGGVVGANSGDVNNCHNTGSVSVTATGVESFYSYVGGVVGSNESDATVSNCYNTGAVSGTSEDHSCYVGGVVGCNSGWVTNCYNTGFVSGTSEEDTSYVGGVVGYNEYAVSECFNEGSVTGEGRPSVGGVVGKYYGDGGDVTNCYNTGSVTGVGTVCVGGVVGEYYGNGGDVTNCYNTGSVTGVGSSYYVGGVVGYNGSQVNTCYNTGSVSVTATGEGSSRYVGGVVGANGGQVTTCYYLSGTAEKGVGNDNGTAEAMNESFFEGVKMAEFLNDNQVDSPWEYISGKSAPTLKAFNKG